jgi:hypothetical protein
VGWRRETPEPVPRGVAALAVLLAATPRPRAATLQSGKPADAAADDPAILMKRVGERVRDYYDRVTSIMCSEVVTQQAMRANLTGTGKPQETVYDLMIVRQPSAAGHIQGEVVVERRIKSINGRPARPEDRPHWADPSPINIPVPWRMGPSQPLTAERLETTLHFAVVKFQDPEEPLLLPKSVERIIVVRGSGVPRLRTVQRFGDFRRFRSEVKIKGVR